MAPLSQGEAVSSLKRPGGRRVHRASAGLAFWCLGPFADVTAAPGACDPINWSVHGAHLLLDITVLAVLLAIPLQFTPLSKHAAELTASECGTLAAGPFSEAGRTAAAAGRRQSVLIANASLPAAGSQPLPQRSIGRGVSFVANSSLRNVVTSAARLSGGMDSLVAETAEVPRAGCSHITVPGGSVAATAPPAPPPGAAAELGIQQSTAEGGLVGPVALQQPRSSRLGSGVRCSSVIPATASIAEEGELEAETALGVSTADTSGMSHSAAHEVLAPPIVVAEVDAATRVSLVAGAQALPSVAVHSGAATERSGAGEAVVAGSAAPSDAREVEEEAEHPCEDGSTVSESMPMLGVMSKSADAVPDWVPPVVSE